ncbi:MAG: efflux RND transporter permease subunit [bacterium]
MVYNQANFITAAINGLVMNAIQGGLLAFIVIFLFLNSVFLAIIVSLSIPISILITLFMIYTLNMAFNTAVTINMMSLGGLALGVGMLVDNSIVVIENIFRHYKQTNDIDSSSITGAEEMSGAITSSTLTSVAVFFPLIVFVTGLAGQVFSELSLTVILSLIASLLVALSLIPRLTSTMKLEISSKQKEFINKIIPNKFIWWKLKTSTLLKGTFLKFMPKGLQIDNNLPIAPQYYKHLIVKLLDIKEKFLIVVGIVFIISLFAFLFIEKKFLPTIDEGQFLINVDLPIGSRLEVTNRVVKRIEDEIKNLAQIKSLMVQVGATSEQAIETLRPSQAQIVINIYRSKNDLPRTKRFSVEKFIPTKDLIEVIRQNLNGIDLEGARITFAMQDNVFKSLAEKSSPIIIEIKGQDMDKIKTIVDDISSKIKSIEGVVNVRDDRPLSSPETKINIDKDKASIFNLSVADIARTALIAVKGVVASKYKEEGNEYDILVRLAERDRKDIVSIQSLLVHAPEGFNFPIKEVAKIINGKGPSEIKRVNLQRTVMISADLHKTSLSKVKPQIDSILDKYKQISGYSATLSGETEKIKESFLSLLFSLILAVALVYMIMAAKFESLYQPFIILFTFPLALIGVVLALLVTFSSLNAISLMGIIILGGIVVNNGIVLIDYINHLRSQGIGVREAVINASVVRLRPILMTATTTILGLMPLALGIGEGAELRSPMAITVIGGLLVSTVLTLGVIPTIYVIIEDFRSKYSLKNRLSK